MSNSWYIVTNTENLTHYINYGLIIDKQGFLQPNAAQSSYLIDAMEDIPLGYLPCFSAERLPSALAKAKEEDRHLKGCLLEIDMKQISPFNAWSGFIETPNLIHNQRALSSDALINADDTNCVLLPAPLPFSVIKSIIVEDTPTRDKIKDIYHEKFQAGAESRRFFAVTPTLFKAPKGGVTDAANSAEDLLKSAQGWQIEPRLLDYQKAFSYGGALGLLYYQTKNGKQTTEIFEKLTALTSTLNDGYQTNPANQNPISPLFDYLSNAGAPTSDIDIIYNKLIDKLAIIDNHGVACEFILSTLKSAAIPEHYKDKCFKLSISLEKIIERTADKDPETILKIIIHSLYPEDIDFKNFAFLITLFFLRDHTETLLKYHHPEFTEAHYALLALFFGLTSGSVNIPSHIRQYYDLSSWLSFKMAEYMHGTYGRSITLKAPVKPLVLYGEYIKDRPSKNFKVHSFYEWLSKRFYPANEDAKNPLIQWKISLPKRYSVEDNKYLISEAKPEILATLNNERLEHDIQAKIKSDKLFDFNEITAAYKKLTK